MRMLNRITSGLTNIGLVGALILGYIYFINEIFGADQSLISRIFFGVVAVAVFVGGYFDEEAE